MATQKGKEKTEGLDDGAPEPTLEERLEGLNLQGEEEEDLDFSEEFEELTKDVRWFACLGFIRRNRLAMRLYSVR